ncbi:hemolysin XhlA family protein [Oceaniglobus roseus]|uniref:hemolysin XhlA family protein n=1 Tax=Oceaniglobus roseus TaxID=1737570 RepID=UPI000C7EB1BC|nr:hemolysin XhlA family protein [Kandeliimicrobium roseum]
MDEAWRQAIEARLIAAETRNAVDEVHRVNVEKRLSAIEDTLKWLVRLIVGAMLMAALTLLFREGVIPG